jgi:predicted ATP-binding protein involved in virulence
MKLTQVEIENFRCFERLSVPLEPDVTAIIGVNAAGKTALLDAIAMSLLGLYEDVFARQPQWPSLDSNVFFESFAGAWFRASDIRLDAPSYPTELGAERSLRITATATCDDRAPAPAFAIQWEHTMASTTAGLHRFSQRWTGNHRVDTAPGGLYVSESEEGQRRHISIPALAYYRDTRDSQFLSLPRETEWQPADPDAARHMALNAAADFAESQRWFYVRENIELREAKKQKDFELTDPVLEAIRNAVLCMLDGLDRIYADEDPPRMKAEIRLAGDSASTLDFSQLSAGQRNLMALTIDFARRLALAFPGWDNPLEAPGILLIDEIELNLHPKWQQTVIPHLRKVFPNTQLIVATHSPIVLSTLEAGQIRILKDQKLFAAPVKTYGSDTGRIQWLVMDTETRPPDNPVAQAIEQVYATINDGELDKAERLLNALEAKLDSDDPALIEARTLIETQRWEKEIGL